MDVQFCTVVMPNAEQLRAALRGVPYEIGTTAYKNAMRAGAKVIKDAVVAAAPTGKRYRFRSEYDRIKAGSADPGTAYGLRVPGNLKKAITIASRHGRHPYEFCWAIGVTSGASAKFDAFYARFVELGTSQAPAHAFMLPAFNAVQEETVNRIARVLTLAIERYATKVSAGSGFRQYLNPALASFDRAA